jgi:hypothetical protein
MRSRALFLLVLLGSCGSEPTFEDRYDGAEREIRQKTEELQKDLDRAAPDEATGAPERRGTATASAP